MFSFDDSRGIRAFARVGGACACACTSGHADVMLPSIVLLLRAPTSWLGMFAQVCLALFWHHFRSMSSCWSRVLRSLAFSLSRGRDIPVFLLRFCDFRHVLRVECRECILCSRVLSPRNGTAYGKRALVLDCFIAVRFGAVGCTKTSVAFSTCLAFDLLLWLRLSTATLVGCSSCASEAAPADACDHCGPHKQGPFRNDFSLFIKHLPKFNVVRSIRSALAPVRESISPPILRRKKLLYKYTKEKFSPSLDLHACLECWGVYRTQIQRQASHTHGIPRNPHFILEARTYRPARQHTDRERAHGCCGQVLFRDAPTVLMRALCETLPPNSKLRKLQTFSNNPPTDPLIATS